MGGHKKSRAPHSFWLARIEWTAQKKRQQLRPGRGEGSNAVGVPHPNSIKDPTTSSRPMSEPHCPASASHARSAPVFFTANHLRYKSIDRSQLSGTNCIARSFKTAYVETIRLGSSRFPHSLSLFSNTSPQHLNPYRIPLSSSCAMSDHDIAGK